MEKTNEVEIKKMLKEREVLYGYRQVKKALKDGKTETIIISNDNRSKNEFKDCLEFDSDSKKLGIACGKSFNISVLAVLKAK